MAAPIDSIVAGEVIVVAAVVIIFLPSAVRRPPPVFCCHLPPLLIVIFPSILTPYSPLTPPLFCQYTPRSPHIVHATQFTIRHCVGWCVVFTNTMDCAQIKRRRRRLWCADDAYALGWGTLMPQAMVWAKAA